jgi:hypothetical protein
MSKFEVGDKVKIICLDKKNHLYVHLMNEWLGKQGELLGIDINSSEAIVKIDDGFGLWMPMSWLKLVKKKKKYWTGKVICVDNGVDSFSDPKLFTTGKVYEVKEGLLFDDTNTPLSSRRYETLNKLINDMAQRGARKFIEFKGFADTGKEEKQ